MRSLCLDVHLSIVQGATSSSDDDGAVAVDTLSPEYMEDLFLEAEAELVATSDDPVIGTPRLITGPNEAAQLPTRGPTTDMSPATGELPVGWHPPKALDTAGEDAGNSRLAKAAGLWNKVSGSAVLAGGVVAEVCLSCTLRSCSALSVACQAAVLLWRKCHVPFLSMSDDAEGSVGGMGCIWFDSNATHLTALLLSSGH